MLISEWPVWARIRTRVVAYDGQGNNSAQSANANASVSTSVGIAVPGLVAYYNFNEGQGSVVHDCSGNGNDGVIDPTNWSNSGKWGSGLALSSNNWVTVPDSSSLELTTGLTLEAWVQPTLINGMVYLASKGLSPQSDYDAGMQQFMGGNTYSFQIDLPNVYPPSFSAASFTGDTWTHLAYTFDGATVYTYVNGYQPADRRSRSVCDELIIEDANFIESAMHRVQPRLSLGRGDDGRRSYLQPGT